MTATDPRRVVETVWRMESARIVAGLARLVRDVGLAEELAQDALVIALEQWPVTGVPDASGLLADGHRQAPGRRRCSAGRAGTGRNSTRSAGRRRRPTTPTSPRTWTTTSATTCCG